jgi:uncharacterized damage-inducible protein DinB
VIETACKVNVFLLGYGKMLVDDVPDERMAEQPHADINHPAWILGHLATSAESMLARVGEAKSLPEDWFTRFGAGSKPTPLRADYPSKVELWGALEHANQRIRDFVANAPAERLAAPTTIARAKEILPTAKEMIAFVLTGHVGVHFGQLSMWRRLIGLPPLF